MNTRIVRRNQRKTTGESPERQIALARRRRIRILTSDAIISGDRSMWGMRWLRERLSEGWLCYWIAGGIVVLLAYHVQYRAREWSVIGRWLRDMFDSWTGSTF